MIFTFANRIGLKRSFSLVIKRAMSSHYSAVVIGSGQAGGPLATAFAKAGHMVALIESIHVGGTCINEGCTPTKTMVASARVAHLTGRAPEYGAQYKKSSLAMNMEIVRKRKRDIVDSFRGGSEGRLKNTENLDLIMGRAKFTGPKEIEVTLNDSKATQTITADRFFINAGCSPAPLKAKDAEKFKILNSTTIMELPEVPKHLVVVGGGYVGIEFAQMFRRFGSKVSVIQRGSHLLPKEDPDVSDAVKEILQQAGVEIYLNAQTDRVSNVPTGQLILSLTLADGEPKTILCSHMLAAAGRIPNTTALELSAAGVETDAHGFIKVNEYLQTSNEHVYALGDIKGGPQFTHIAYDDYRIIRNNVITNSQAPSPSSTKDRLVPYTVFMDPQLGRIGHSETSARAAGVSDIKVASMPMAYVARALETDESKGFMKAVVDAESKQILGFTCLGIEGGELMSMVQIAMMGGLTYEDLENAVFAHPCLSESLNNLWGFLK